MMLDESIVAVSPSSVYRVLQSEGLLETNNTKPSLKGTGFVQPLKPHEHWHTDISYVNISGTFYYLCSVLDGCSRAILSWDIKPSMTESDVEIIIQKAKETYPNQSPRVISVNGPQFIAKDFKEFIRFSGMSHVRTSPYYPQSNGKIERWHKTLKVTCIRPKQFETLDEVKQGVSDFIHHYNHTRLHSALGYIAPITKLKGEGKGVLEMRDRQLAEALATRKKMRSKAA